MVAAIADDSNALILPATSKKKTKDKLKPQSRSCENKKLSKSQKRKLKKLEEEKKKDQLLAKSLETLEKCSISDDVYSLLWASEKIGQAETMKEKRRREMHFCKAGLQVPETEKCPKRKKVDSSDNEADDCDISASGVSDKTLTSQPVIIENDDNRNDTFAFSVSSQGSGQQTGLRDQCGTEPNELVMQVESEDHCKGVQLDARNASVPQSLDDDNETTTAEGKLDDSRPDTYETSCVEGDPVRGPLVPPTVIHVSRPKEVESGRKDLPIIMMEQEIMEAISNHISVIICGETGCGKTTQIPQFLYEAGYGSTKCAMRSGVIGVTQPRRVAVLSTARRVAYELGVRLGREVGFQVRHDKRIGENCSIKFMTDGILMRELQCDFLLKRYSVIILDEAHERSLNTDILIGMLSRVIRQRQAIYEDQQQKLQAGEEIQNRVYPLKLILMSATLRVEDFTSGRRIFHDPPPVIEIPARQFPVTKHFSKKTELVDYIGEAYKMVLKIHKRLPPGGILVFVTGQREVEDLCRKLRQASKKFEKEGSEVNTQNETTTESDIYQIDGHNLEEIDEALDTHASSVVQETDRFSSCDADHDGPDDYDWYSSDSSGTDSELDFEVDDEDHQKISKVDGENVDVDSLKAAFEALAGKTASTSESNQEDRNITMSEGCSNESNPSLTDKNREKKSLVVGPLRVLPLYAMLPAAAQLRVFEEVKGGERLVVVATNVAETSLTIPGIKYVVDTGREKVKNYNSSNGMESYEIQWISKASAAQRAGRAGRTGPGHCYCLYSSAALTNQFPEFSCAEILKIPVDGVVLLMKSMGISKVANFPFPTPPDAADLVEAERCLKVLEALDSDGRLTPLGKTMAQYPMSPRHARLLLLAIQIMKEDIRHVQPDLVLGYAVAVTAALSLSNPFIDASRNSTEGMEQDENQNQRAKLMRKQMKESAKNRAKFSNLKSDAITAAYALQCFEQSKNPPEFCSENTLSLKTMEEMSKLRKQLLQLVFHQRHSGLQEYSWSHGTLEDVEAHWRFPTDKYPLTQIEEDILCQAIYAGWADRVAKRVRATSALSEGDSKVNAIRYQATMVKETVFLRRWSSVSKSAPDFLVYHEMLQTKRPYIHGATSVKSEWLVKYGGSLCTYSSPLKDPQPFYDPYSDQVFCYVVPNFGPHLWELPLSKVPIKDVENRVAVFAYALLDGHVLPCFKPVKEILAAPPSSILKPESLGQKRVGNLLSKLKTKSRTIDTCAKLREAWTENSQWLHSEIMAWVQERFRHIFEDLWATMHQEAFLAPQDRFQKRTKRRKYES